MPGADYGFYIWTAYGATGFAVLALLAWSVLDHRAQVRALARLDGGDDPARRSPHG